jgi:hypothetical protein
MRLCIYVVSITLPNSYLLFADIVQPYKQRLEEQGHDVVVSRLPMPDRKNIVFGANILPAGCVFPCDTIIVDLEQLHDSSPFNKPSYLSYLSSYAVWSYSRSNVEWLHKKGITHAIHVPLGHADPLSSAMSTRPPSDSERDIDLLFMGAMSPRRASLKQALETCGRPLKIVFAYEVYGAERDKLLNRAKIVLNVAYWDSFHQLEIVRIGYALANAAFVISETADNLGEYEDLLPGMIIGKYNQLVPLVLLYLDQPEERERIAQLGYECFRARPLALPLLPKDDRTDIKPDRTVPKVLQPLMSKESSVYWNAPIDIRLMSRVLLSMSGGRFYLPLDTDVATVRTMIAIAKRSKVAIVIDAHPPTVDMCILPHQPIKARESVPISALL